MRTAEYGDLTALGARLVELEHERSEARDHVRLLLALQDAFASIAVTRSPDDVVAQMLRAAHDPLGFSRGIFFHVERERGVVPRWQFDGSDSVEASHESFDLRPGSAVVRALRSDATLCVGRAEDLSAPLVDTRGWYVLSALACTEGTAGLLYLDGHRVRTPRDWETGLVHALATLASVSIENSMLFARTEELAIRDPLTGLYNRRAFAARLDDALATARTTGRPLTFVLIDVDDFKRINDSLGHVHGDDVLRRLAQALVRHSRSGDVVGRFAGDEFVASLSNIDGELARGLVARLSADLRSNGLRCSLGAAVFPTDACDAAGLLSAADRALYAAKAAGKDGYSFA
jgi:diguanylate cyclase (GGDEF)-like protein